MIDCEHDTLIPIQQLCRDRLGKRIAPATLWRWIRKGCRGAKLEAVQACGVWCSTPPAVAEFLRAQTAAALAPPADADTGDRPETIQRRLEAAGLLREGGR